MKKSKYLIITFPASQFDLSNQKLSKYSLAFIGENLSKDELANKGFNAILKNENILSIGFMKNENVFNFHKELSLIEEKILVKKSHFIVLLDYQVPRIYRSGEYRPSEESFLISRDKFRQFYTEDISTGLCYHLMLEALADKKGLEQILVHQMKHPKPLFSQSNNQTESAEIIIPHRGNIEDLKDLETALWYLKNQRVAPQKISVCFDEFVTDNHFNIVDNYKETRFFVNFPTGVGPYPSRDILARTTKEDLIIFHDSDDVSTLDRVAILTDVLKNKNLDAVGSHELRVNKIEKRIEAVRFPLDVIGLENKQDWHSIFFPTTAIKKSAYLKTGGLSTIRRHSSDSQFYWRAHFFLNIKNVDEFLYIRIKRENSLTTASSTALGTIVRERLNRQWRTDFVRIVNRNIGLLESTLIDEYNVAEVDVISLRKENRDTILKWQELRNSLQKMSLSKETEIPAFPNKNDISEERILDYRLVKDPGIEELKKSFSWRIGWKITRGIVLLLGWIPFVKKRL